jgi:hypothetical protein
VISMEPPDDHGFAPNVDLCLLAFIFLVFPFSHSFPCLPSHPESAICDIWERIRVSEATVGGLGTSYTPNLPFRRQAGPSPRVSGPLPDSCTTLV